MRHTLRHPVRQFRALAHAEPSPRAAAFLLTLNALFAAILCYTSSWLAALLEEAVRDELRQGGNIATALVVTGVFIVSYPLGLLAASLIAAGLFSFIAGVAGMAAVLAARLRGRRLRASTIWTVTSHASYGAVLVGLVAVAFSLALWLAEPILGGPGSSLGRITSASPLIELAALASASAAWLVYAAVAIRVIAGMAPSEVRTQEALPSPNFRSPRLSRPPSVVTIAAAILASAAAMWSMSSPGRSRTLLILTTALWCSVAAIEAFKWVGCSTSPRRSRAHLLRWLAAPTVLLVTLGLIQAELPLRWRFAASKAALQALADEVVAGRQKPTGPSKRAGLFWSYGAFWLTDGAVSVGIDGDNAYYANGFLFFPNGKPDDPILHRGTTQLECRKIDANWYIWHYRKP